MKMRKESKLLCAGFTLIELSIVLVIIGLIVGGVLVGRDLINASEVRSQIGQIEKYQQATNTFRVKYGFIPGDLLAKDASQFGFATRAGTQGRGDGNGLLDGIDHNGNPNNNSISGGETAMFWVDLSTARLIDGNFTAATTSAAAASGTQLDSYMPKAKIGKGNYIHTWGGGWSGYDGKNYFEIVKVLAFSLSYSSPDVNVSIPVAQAYNIDKKIDDGFPMIGNVTTLLDDHGSSTYYWAGAAGYYGDVTTQQMDGSSTTCFDNSVTANGTPGVNGNVQHYSVEINNGAGTNCALMIKFQ